MPGSLKGLLEKNTEPYLLAKAKQNEANQMKQHGLPTGSSVDVMHPSQNSLFRSFPDLSCLWSSPLENHLWNHHLALCKHLESSLTHPVFLSHHIWLLDLSSLNLVGYPESAPLTACICALDGCNSLLGDVPSSTSILLACVILSKYQPSLAVSLVSTNSHHTRTKWSPAPYVIYPLPLTSCPSLLPLALAVLIVWNTSLQIFARLLPLCLQISTQTSLLWEDCPEHPVFTASPFSVLPTTVSS